MAVPKISGQTSLKLGACVMNSRVVGRLLNAIPRTHRPCGMILMWGLFPIFVLFTPEGFAKRSEKPTHCNTCTVQMKSGRGVWVRNPKRAFGRKATIDLFLAAVETVRTTFSGTPDLMVGDISFQHGGRMRPHRSHRDGRDIDAGFYFRNGRARRYFAKPRGRSLDLARTWTLFNALIATGQVEFIFVSYRIQRALHRYAQKQGVSKRKLRRFFQWPRHWRRRVGIIRWERGHDDHFHVRFRPKVKEASRRELLKGE